MSIRESAVKNKDVKIHYLESDAESNLTPLVYIPGMLGSAEVFVDEMESLYPRKCISISLRGRGKSDVPSTGYSLIDHVSDIESVVNHCNLNKFVLMAYSMGVPYAIEFAAKNPSLIKGLIILDYPARLPNISSQWVENVVNRFGTSIEQFAISIQKETYETELWIKLNVINSPVLVVRGGKEGAILNEGYAKKYEEVISNLSMIEFKESGHELWEPSYERFISTINNFLDLIDKDKHNVT